VQEKINEGGQLIDVRSPIEFNMGALDGAINMPISNFQSLMDEIDDTKPVLLYCRTGARSEAVKNYLVQLGFAQVHNIGGLQQFAGC
jgi:phage shock protein E